MKHITADDQPDTVKQFLLSLDIDSEGAIIECEGRRFTVTEVVSQNDIAAIRQGVAEMNAGKARPFTDADTELRSKMGFTPRSE